MANEFYRLDLVIGIDGDEQAKGKLRAMDRFMEHTRKRGEMLSRMQASPAVRLNNQFSGPAQMIEQHMQRMQRAAGVLDRTKIAPLLTARDNLTNSVLHAGQVIKKLDVEHASPVIAAQDRISSVITRINAALNAINRGNFSAVVGMKGDIIDEINKAKTALATLDKVKSGPMAELRGELFGQLTKAMAELRKLDYLDAEPEATLRDKVTWRARQVSSVLRGITSRAWVVTIQAKDQVINVARRITGALASPLGMLGAGAGVYGIGKLTVGAAAQFEGYTASMEHWLKGNKTLAQETMKWAEKFSDVTPFTPEELFPGVSRAIAIEKGMVEPAKRLVALSGEMAATQPGKTVLDAMEALADAKQGEFERMKEFGMKISQEEFRRLGGWKGFLKETESIFAGAMARFAKTSLGLLSTIIGKIKGLFRAAGFGMLEVIKPRLEKIVDWFDRNKETVERWKNNLARLGKEAFDKMFSWGEKALGKIEKRLSSPALKNADWGTKLVAILDEAADIALPKAGEVGFNLGCKIGMGLGKGIFEAAKNDPILKAVLSGWVGSKVPGPWQVKLAVGAGLFVAPEVAKAGKTIGKKIPGTEYYTEQKVKEYTEAKAMPTIKGGEIRARKETFGERIKKSIGYAKGGILTRPHLGMVAEAGPEAVIPLSTQMRGRALKLWQQTGEILGTNKISSINTNIQNTAIGFESFDKGHRITVKSIYKNYESRLKKATTLMEMEKIRGTAHEAINLSSKYRYIAKAFSRVILPLSLLTPVINIVSTSDKKQAIINEVGQILGSAAAGVISPFTAMSGAIVGAGLGAFGGQAIARNLYNKRIAKHAEGGFFIRPHLGLVAEAGPEAIIPLSAGKRSQAINLFQKVADILGLDRMGDLMTLEKGKTIQGFSEGTNIKNAFVYPVSAKLETATAKIVPLKPEFDIFTSVPEVGVVRQIGKKIKTNITEKINIMTEKLKEVIAGASSFATKLISSTKIIIEKTQQSMVAGFPGAFSRSKELISLVQSISPRFGLPPALLAAVIQAESSWNPRAISPMGAIGLTQVMPGTAKAMEYNPAELARNPALQIEAGAKYLSQMLWRFKSIPLAVAAYNAGPGAVEKYGGIPPYKETRVYVNRVMSMFAKHEVGGIFTKPHLGLVAEAGMEAIIPLSSRRRTRAMDLWQRAGIILGAIPAVPELSSRATINPILKAISRIPGVVGKTVLKPEKILPKIPELIDKAVINQVLKRLPISPNLAGKVVINPALRAVSKLPSLISSISQLPFNLGREQLQIVEHATGGILTRPHLGLIAEAGPEVVIPLSSRLHTHSLELWEQTGKYLGVKSYAQGGFMGGGFTEQLPVTNFKAGNKSINITVDGITVNMAGNEIDEEELAMKIGWQITKQIKKVLRNTA